MSDKDTKRIYLDYASSTPLRSEIYEVMKPYWQKKFANPQATHQEGSETHHVVEQSRQQIATTLGVQPSEIIFTSGATESNSLALVGCAYAYTDTFQNNPTVLVGSITHPSVRNVGTSYKKHMNVVEIPVSEDGRLQVDELLSQITEDTAIISISHANSEIGTLQPVAKISAEVQKYRQEHDTQYPLLHIDVSQSTLYMSVQPETLGADLLTINSQKIHGPKGIGLLWVRSGTPMASLFVSNVTRQVGDYQQLRPGTQPVPLVAGMGVAIAWAQNNYDEHGQFVRELQTYFITSLQECFPDIRINGSVEYRIPHNVSITLPDTDHDYLAARLDKAGIAAATTSACQARYSDTSSVITEINGDDAVRFSLGIHTTKDELDHVITVLQQLV